MARIKDLIDQYCLLFNAFVRLMYVNQCCFVLNSLLMGSVSDSAGFLISIGLSTPVLVSIHLMDSFDEANKLIVQCQVLLKEDDMFYSLYHKLENISNQLEYLISQDMDS